MAAGHVGSGGGAAVSDSEHQGGGVAEQRTKLNEAIYVRQEERRGILSLSRSRWRLRAKRRWFWLDVGGRSAVRDIHIDFFMSDDSLPQTASTGPILGGNES